MNNIVNSSPSRPLRYLQDYPADTLAQVEQLLQQDRVADWLLKKYPQAHTIRTDRALFDYVHALKAEYLRGAAPVDKVLFDAKLHVVKNALGTHTMVSRVQGNKLKAKREIRIASLFKIVPDEFLKMITVHELAHLKERAHGCGVHRKPLLLRPTDPPTFVHQNKYLRNGDGLASAYLVKARHDGNRN